MLRRQLHKVVKSLGVKYCVVQDKGICRKFSPVKCVQDGVQVTKNNNQRCLKYESKELHKERAWDLDAIFVGRTGQLRVIDSFGRRVPRKLWRGKRIGMPVIIPLSRGGIKVIKSVKAAGGIPIHTRTGEVL